MKGVIVALFTMLGLGTLLLGIGCLRDSKRNDEANARFEENVRELSRNTEKLKELLRRQKQLDKQGEELRRMNEELMRIIKKDYPDIMIIG